MSAEQVEEKKTEENRKIIAVLGITGHQGQHVMQQLLQCSDKYKIRGITRNLKSTKAQNIISQHDKEKIEMVEGNPREPDKLVNILNGCYGIWFLVCWKGKGNSGKTEGTDGISIVECALKANIKHIIFSSVADSNTDSPGKFKVEQFIKAQPQFKDNKSIYTILKPVTFMDNFANPEIAGISDKKRKITFLTSEDTELQLTSHKDVARFTVHALNYCDTEINDNNDKDKDKKQVFYNNEITLVGDIQTGKKIVELMSDKVGVKLEWSQFNVLMLGIMYTFYKKLEKEGGFRVKKQDIDALKKIEPDLWDFETWLKHQDIKLASNDDEKEIESEQNENNNCIIL